MKNLILKYEETREKVPTIKCDKYYLHSKYAPVKEARRLAEEQYRPHHLHVVFGFGAGYFVEELIDQFKFNEPILLIDPLIDSNSIIFENKKNYERLYHVTTDSYQAIEIIANKLSDFTTNITLIVSPNYNHIFPSELKDIAELIRDTQNRQYTNIYTSAYFALNWQINYTMNLQNIEKDLSLNVLKKKYSAPVVIAAGGPSLTKQLPNLKKYREKIILICAGSTINSLLEASIIPDYVVSIDGGEENYQHFKKLNLSDSQLIYSPTMHYKIRDSFNGNALVMVPNVKSALSEHLKNYFSKDYPIISGGGSVAHFSLSVAKYISSGPICLIGQDLAFTDDLTHASGNRHSQKNTDHKMKVIGYNGDTVYTDSKFKTMINTFNEMQVLEKHENVVFNCTEGGAKLSKYKQMPFEEYLNLYTKENITKLNLDEFDLEKGEFKFNWKKDKEQYNIILSLLKEGLSLVKTYNDEIFSPKFAKKISDIENKLNKMYKKTCLDMLLEPNIVFAEHQFLPKLNENKQEEALRVKTYIIELYSSCLESIEKYIREVESILEEQIDVRN